MSSIWDTIRTSVGDITVLLEGVFQRGGGGTIPDDKCCSLARLDRECQWVGKKANFTCPPRYYRQYWVCVEGTRQIGCGECTTDPTSCFGGCYDCSIWWYT